MRHFSVFIYIYKSFGDELMFLSYKWEDWYIDDVVLSHFYV